MTDVRCRGTVQTFPRFREGGGFVARCTSCRGETQAPTAEAAIDRFVHVLDADFEAWEQEVQQAREPVRGDSPWSRAWIATGQHAGTSTCPICRRQWLVTPADDCLMPSCGCFGFDSSAANTQRPCQRCGITHALNCLERKR